MSKKKTILIYTLAIISTIFAIVVIILFCKIFADSVPEIEFETETQKDISLDTYDDLTDDNELVVNGTESGVIIEDVVEVDEGPIDYSSAPQGTAYGLEIESISEYIDVLNDVIGEGFSEIVNDSLRHEVEYAVKRYCVDNDIKEVFNLSNDVAGNPTEMRITRVATSDSRTLYITTDYSQNLIGVTEDYEPEGFME